MPRPRVKYNTHIPNIDAPNSDTHLWRIQYEYTQKQCMGVAIEGIDIWYVGIIVLQRQKVMDLKRWQHVVYTRVFWRYLSYFFQFPSISPMF